MATCEGCAPRRSAARASGPPGLARRPVASGNQGMNPMLPLVQNSSTSSDFRSTRLYRFWTQTTAVNFWTASICPIVTSDSPMWRIFPSRRRSSSAPI